MSGGKEQIAVWKVGVWKRRSEVFAGSPLSPSLPSLLYAAPFSAGGHQGSAASPLHCSCALC